MPTSLDLAAIQQAAQRIKPHIHRTPVLTSQTFNRMLGAELYFKCENFQKAGAFKARGACNAVFSLSDDEAKRGVLTHSSGNHAAALAMAAQRRGIKAYIVMPDNAPAVKRAAVEGYGGQVHISEPSLTAREALAASLMQETGAVMVHPYNDHRVMAGQGTAALELLEEAPELDYLLTPLGGGGLVSGCAIAAAGVSPRTKVVGVEPQAADFACRSLAKGEIVKQDKAPETVADGLRTSPGELTFPVIKEYLDQVLSVPDKDTITALAMILERMKIVVEPSSAVPLAAIMAGKLDVSGKKVGIVFSGGNLDLKNLAGIMAG